MTESADTNKRARPVLLDPGSTWLPIGKFAVAVVLCAGAISSVERLLRDVGEIKAEFQAFRTDFRDALANRPHVDSLNAWQREFQSRNPSLQVPEFRAPGG